MTDPLKLISYCGLYCGLCSHRNRIAKQARSLKESMAKEGYEYFGPEIPSFKEFWEFLDTMAKNDSEDAGCTCRTGGGPPFCGIRKCAISKNVDICANCTEFPCHRINGLAKGYTLLLSDAKRLKEIGIESWVKEQEARKDTGFCYVDIRCSPYEIPSD